MLNSRGQNTTAVLPTRTWMNPSAPEKAEYFERDQTAYILEGYGDDPNKKVHRVLTSYGRGDWAIGSKHALHHDQTMEQLGEWEVVGIVTFFDFRVDGNAPNKKMPHWVFK